MATIQVFVEMVLSHFWSDPGSPTVLEYWPLLDGGRLACVPCSGFNKKRCQNRPFFQREGGRGREGEKKKEKGRKGERERGREGERKREKKKEKKEKKKKEEKNKEKKKEKKKRIKSG